VNAVAVRRASNFDDVARDLADGHWVVYPYEAYRQLDRAEWNDQLVKHLDRYGIAADIIDMPEKDLVVVVNVRALPSRNQVIESIAVIEHQRAMGRL